MSRHYSHDVLIIGSGIAGLSLALSLSQRGRIAVLSKSEMQQGSSFYAQGGIAAVIDPDDSTDSHVQDTLSAGAGLCDEAAVRFTVKNSKASVEWLIDQGVAFTREEDHDAYHLTKEGGHSHRRILHAADATGKVVVETLIDNVLDHNRIDIFENRVAVDLITHNGACIGAYVLDQSSGHIDSFQARFVVLATGGASKVYLYTSNPDGASGDGIAMAWRAGCRVANMEFNQFHPTCLYHPQAKSFLLTEALRGEGAYLRLADGERFMHRFDQRLELAPRDIVARAIDHEMKRLGSDCVYLDITHKPADFIANHFPTVMQACARFGMDISREPIPVVPAAHYSCGGIMIDQNGRTDVASLYAIGETTFTGLHGANRMASNSLLECIVYAKSACAHIESLWESVEFAPRPAPWDESLVTDSDEDVVIAHNWDELRRFMWDYVGIVRTDKRLQRALNRVALLQAEIAEYYSNYKISSDLIELRNLAQVADLIIRSAMQRKESRGLHYTLDYPELLSEARNTVLDPTTD